MDQAVASSSGSAVTNHEGWQLSAKGRKFKAKGVTVLNVKDFGGKGRTSNQKWLM